MGAESLFSASRQFIEQGGYEVAGSGDARGAYPIDETEALAELDRAEDALRNWSECYPEDVFIPPTKEQIRAATDLLRANGFTPDALYAEWGRHIVRCIVEAVRG